jgi:curved DNA-binding protein CbpA
MNHREVLGVSPTADSNEIKQAFRKAAMEQHPDHSSSPEAEEAFGRIKEARDALLDKAAIREDIQAINQSVAQAFHATAQAASTAYATSPPTAPDPAVIAKTQKLDDAALHPPKRGLFKKSQELQEVIKHRKKLRTNSRRIQGIY